MATEAQPGRLCLSKSGRDKGRYFIIKEVSQDGCVYVVDGMLRKMQNPKKKKLRHVELKPEVIKAIAEKFVTGAKVFDAEVASAILGSGYTDK